MNDLDVVEAFIAFLGDNGYPGLRIDRRPEEENRKSKDIEAIAGPFAIEHTFVPRFPYQKAQDDWFVKAMAGLESELAAPPYEFNICSEYDAVKKGQDWSAIRNALKTWIMQKAHDLADGEHLFGDISGIPFSLLVEKISDGKPGINFLRRLPKKDDPVRHIRVREQLEPKIEKLIPYKKLGLTTVLLVGCQISRNQMLATIRESFPQGLHTDLDEIWYVLTYGNESRNFTKLPL